MEDLFRRELAGRKSLLERILRERFDVLGVFGDAVAPEIGAHQLNGILHIDLRPRQRDLGGRHLLHLVDGDGLGLTERLVDRCGQPWILLDQGLADADQMHDREHAGALVVVHLDLPIVREQKADIGCAIHEGRYLACAEHCVELAVDQHLVERLARCNRLQVDAVAKLQRRALVAARLLLAAGAPMDIGRLYAVVFLEDAAHPDIGGLLIFRQADELALQIGGIANVTVGSDEDR